MKKFAFLALTVGLMSCATNPRPGTSEQALSGRIPSSAIDLSGDYLGEGLFDQRKKGVERPAIRLYLERATDGSDAYYGVLLEYQRLLKIAPRYAATQYAPRLNKVIGYLNSIATQVSAYKFVPGRQIGTYQMHKLEVRDGQIFPASDFTMTLRLRPENLETATPLADATIEGNVDGPISFPVRDNFWVKQFDLVQFTYKLGKLASSWRGNWEDLEGSYLSQYGRLNDGVLELYTELGQKKMKFFKSKLRPNLFTNPKSANIVGDYNVSEPVPKMYVLTPASQDNAAGSDNEMGGRIGLFLDVFDASAPEAGSQMVTELVFTNPQDDSDFMMYYEHPQHLKDVGVAP